MTKKKNITISKGDVLDIQFKVNGITLDNGGGGRVFFSIKDRLVDDKEISLEAVVDVNINSFRIIVPTSIMKTLEVGTHYYDIVYVNAQGNMRTLIAPKLLVIKEVVHDDLFND